MKLPQSEASQMAEKQPPMKVFMGCGFSSDVSAFIGEDRIRHEGTSALM
jgi:hypothetical protein